MTYTSGSNPELVAIATHSIPLDAGLPCTEGALGLLLLLLLLLLLGLWACCCCCRLPSCCLQAVNWQMLWLCSCMWTCCMHTMLL
jgi:hypothetical protein